MNRRTRYRLFNSRAGRDTMLAIHRVNQQMTVCPYCRTHTPEGTTCEQCGSPLAPSDIDAHFPKLAPLQQQRLAQLLAIGVPAAAAVTFVSPFLTGPLHLFLFTPLLTLVSGIVMHTQLVAPVQWLLSRPRRFVSRWTLRFLFYPAAMWGFAVAGTPLIGAVAGAVTFAGLGLATHHYMMWNARLDFDRTPVRGFERLVLIAAAVAAAALLFVFLAVTALLAWLVSLIF